MKETSTLPYYPRFIFSCSDGKCLSTADLDYLKNAIKNADDKYDSDITHFVPGQIVEFSWKTANDGVEIKLYEVNKVEIHQIKYDLNEPTYGMNSNDCTEIFGKKKRHLMEIYVFLKLRK